MAGKKNKKLFTCASCGGNVVLSNKTGHIEHYNNGAVKIPDYMVMPKCRKCGEVYFSPEREAIMAQVVIEHLLKILNSKGIRY